MARVPFQDQEDLPEEFQYLLEEDVLGQRNIFRVLGNNPAILQSYMRFGNTLWKDSGLSERMVELIILSVARELDSTYEWHQHVELGRDAGLSQAEIKAISRGNLEGFDEPERQLMEYAKAVVTETVTEETHSTISSNFSNDQLVGMAMLASYYLATARILQAFEVEPEQKFVGWDIS